MDAEGNKLGKPKEHKIFFTYYKKARHWVDTYQRAILGPECYMTQALKELLKVA